MPDLLQDAGSEAFLVYVGRCAACVGARRKIGLSIGRHQHNRRRGLAALIRLVASIPPMPGILMSMRTRSGRSERASWTASSPDNASAISSKPVVAATTARAARRKGGWSSTTRTPDHRSVPERDRAGDAGSLAGRRLDSQAAADGAEPVGHVRQPPRRVPRRRGRSPRRRPPPRRAAPPSVSQHADGRRGRLACVLAGVLQCLETAEVHGRLDLGRVAADARRPRGESATGRAPRRRKEPRRGRAPPGDGG